MAEQAHLLPAQEPPPLVLQPLLVVERQQDVQVLSSSPRNVFTLYLGGKQCVAVPGNPQGIGDEWCAATGCPADYVEAGICMWSECHDHGAHFDTFSQGGGGYVPNVGTTKSNKYVPMDDSIPPSFLFYGLLLIVWQNWSVFTLLENITCVKKLSNAMSFEVKIQ